MDLHVPPTNKPGVHAYRGKHMEETTHMQITISFGVGNSVTKEYPVGTTVGTVMGDQNLRAVLGYGENVTPVIDGVRQSCACALSNGDEIHIETAVGQKA